MNHTLKKLNSAIAALKELDAVEIVGNFRAFEHECSGGTYCAAVLSVEDGEIYYNNEASWSCSTDEYFSESGVLSRQTILSSTRAHWKPSPDDSFEWDYSGEDYIWDGNNPCSWIPYDSDDIINSANSIVNQKVGYDYEWFSDIDDARDYLISIGWGTFSVSNTPVNGWVSDGNSDSDVCDVQNQIDELIEEIEKEIELLVDAVEA